MGIEEQSVLRRALFGPAGPHSPPRAGCRPVPRRAGGSFETKTIRSRNAVSDRSSVLQRLWRRPQSVWARRALFQIHLWSGIGAGIYLVFISVTGSLLVRSEERRVGKECRSRCSE